MEQVIKEYGIFWVEGLALFCVWTVCMFGIADRESNAGVFSMLGDQLAKESISYESYEDFERGFMQEGQKKAPEISSVNRSLHTGSIKLSDAIWATDYMGNRLPVKVISITNMNGAELIGELEKETLEIIIDAPGIYCVTAYAVDSGNRKAVYSIKIPVNQ